MTRNPPIECTTCGLPLWDATWYRSDPYCEQRCIELAEAIDHSLPLPIDRALNRDHSLCGVEPCSDCR